MRVQSSVLLPPGGGVAEPAQRAAMHGDAWGGILFPEHPPTTQPRCMRSVLRLLPLQGGALARMLFLLLICILLTAFCTLSTAHACDIEDIPFGQSMEIMLEDMPIDLPGITDRQVERVPVRGRDVCRFLPAKSEAELIFTHDKLAVVNLRYENEDYTFLKAITRMLGEPDNGPVMKTQAPAPLRYLWAKDAIIVAYTGNVEGEHYVEQLSITSREHAAARTRLVLAEEE